MASIELDLVWGENGETLEQACASIAGGATFEVIEEHGPGGGWPVVRFAAQDAAGLEPLIVAYASGDEDAAFWRTQVVA